MAPQERDREVTSSYPNDRLETGGLHISVDQVADMEPIRNASTIRRESFLEEFTRADGPPQIVLFIMLVALAFGSTIGVVS